MEPANPAEPWHGGREAERAESIEEEVIVASAGHQQYLPPDAPDMASPEAVENFTAMPLFEVPYAGQFCDPGLLQDRDGAQPPHDVAEPLVPAAFGAKGPFNTRPAYYPHPYPSDSHNISPARGQPSTLGVSQARGIESRTQSESIMGDHLEGYDEEQAKERKRVFLEKNRIAAAKCRSKKKKWVADLEGSKTHLENLNLQLRVEYQHLVDELNKVKSALMNHAHCNDPHITEWLNNQARKIVQTAGPIGDAPVPAAYPVPNPLATYGTQGHQRTSSAVSAGGIVDFGQSPRRSSTYSQGQSSTAATPPIDPALPMLAASPRIKEEALMDLAAVWH